MLIIKRLTRLAGEIVMKRYEITKKFYKHYIIYILVKGKYRLYNVDKEISNNFKLDRVNVIKLNNLDIESIIEYEDNRYVNLYAKTKIIKIINRYRL